MQNDQARLWIKNNQWLVWVTMIFGLIVECTIICGRKLARTVPTNYILLFTFTLCESYLVMYLCSFYSPQIVAIAASFTLAVTVSLTLYAFFTKHDFTYCYAALFLFFTVTFVSSLLMFILPQNRFVIVLYSGLGAIIYGFYLVMDTQMLIGGGRYELSPEDYVIAALIIYLDIIVLFLHILRAIGDKK